MSRMTCLPSKRVTLIKIPTDNAAFEHCIDVTSRLLLKYEPDMFEKTEQKKSDAG